MFLGGDKNVLKSDSDNSYTTSWKYWKLFNYILQTGKSNPNT